MFNIHGNKANVLKEAVSQVKENQSILERWFGDDQEATKVEQCKQEIINNGIIEEMKKIIENSTDRSVE